MAQTISIGKQDFLYLRENNYFYIDKTDFIRQWWESADDITLITRPRRFGKTLNMSMLNYFFSNHYSEKSEIFEKLSIWNSVKYRKLQGAYPVIFISFADVKQGNYKDAVQKVKKIIADVYRQYRYLMDYPDFTVADRRKLSDMTDRIDDVTAQDSLKDLSYFLSEYYKKKVIILLDEYDTPMQEATFMDIGTNSQQDNPPETMLFYNGGAKLTCEGSESLEDLKELKSRGVKILTCGTCLNYYELSDKLAVGEVTNMYDIAEKMAGASLIVSP